MLTAASVGQIETLHDDNRRQRRMKGLQRCRVDPVQEPPGPETTIIASP